MQSSRGSFARPPAAHLLCAALFLTGPGPLPPRESGIPGLEHTLRKEVLYESHMASVGLKESTTCCRADGEEPT